MDGFNADWNGIEVEDQPERRGEPTADAQLQIHLARLFETPGRGSSPAATSRGPTIHERRPVAMVSENLARELWGTPDAALGKRIRGLGRAAGARSIGVVQDVRDNGLNAPSPAIVYWPTFMAGSTAPTPAAFSRQ